MPIEVWINGNWQEICSNTRWPRFLVHNFWIYACSSFILVHSLLATMHQMLSTEIHQLKMEVNRTLSLEGKQHSINVDGQACNVCNKFTIYIVNFMMEQNSNKKIFHKNPFSHKVSKNKQMIKMGHEQKRERTHTRPASPWIVLFWWEEKFEMRIAKEK